MPSFKQNNPTFVGKEWLPLFEGSPMGLRLNDHSIQMTLVQMGVFQMRGHYLRHFKISTNKLLV